MSAGTPAALCVCALGGDDGPALDALLHRLGVGRVGVGEVALRRIADVDTGLVARWSPTRADLFPHAGAAVRRRLARALADLGCPLADRPDPLALFPEAGSEIEARMLAALALDPSPRATDLLLDQPRRWRGFDPDRAGEDDLAPRSLDRLLRPPLVVALGRPNIGKSSLANALAGRDAALVADLPGTTRDHVGLSLTLDGLTLRYLDTPGLHPDADPDPLTAHAARAALELGANADLLLDCRDAATPDDGAPLPPGFDRPGDTPVLTVLLRADRAQRPAGTTGWLATSATTRQGLADLAIGVRRALVPDDALSDPRPWRFWQPA